MGIKTNEDILETEKIFQEILIPLVEKYKGTPLTKSEYNNQPNPILHHAYSTFLSIPLGEFKNANKDTLHFYTQEVSFHYHSEINPNGIGDGNTPDIARSYTLAMSLQTNRKDYYKHDTYKKEYGFHIYSRTLEGLFERCDTSMNEFFEKMQDLG